MQAGRQIPRLRNCKDLKKEFLAAQLELLTGNNFFRRREASPFALLGCYAALICS
jgi:hypothetical protein